VFPHWCTGPELITTRTELTMNWNFHVNVFRQNGYSSRKIRRALYFTERVISPKDKLDSIVCLPYVWATFNRISRALSPYKVK
jgi:hypothetical protein